MANLYLGRWEWIAGEDPHWRAPGGGNVGTLDLRSLPQCGLAGGLPQGYGLFSYPAEVSNPLLEVHLGSDPTAQLSANIRNSISTRLGAFTSRRMGDIVREILLNGDAAGVTAHRPVRGSLRNGLRVDIGGFGRIVNEPFSSEHPGFLRTVDVFRADYRRNKALVSAETLRRFTGAECRKLYGTMDDDKARAILPPEYADDGWEQPRTSVGDTFDRADSGDLNAVDTGKTLDGGAGTWDWTELGAGNWDVFTNRARNNSTTAEYIRCEQDLSSDDQTCYVTVDRIGDTSFVQIGPCARFAAAANTSYMAMFQWTTTPGVILRKTVTGTRSDLGSMQSLTPADNDKLETEINDSTLRSLVNDAQKDSLTDTSITGNLRAGIYANHQFTAAHDFWAQDLGGAAFVPYPFSRGARGGAHSLSGGLQ